MGFVQIAVVQCSKASHSELVTNIATMVCVAVRHCQSTSNSVAIPHKKNRWMAKSFFKQRSNVLVLTQWFGVACVCKT